MGRKGAKSSVIMSDKSEELYDNAVDLIQEGKMEEGITVIEEALMEDPEDGQTWQLYSVVLKANGREEDAANALKKAESFGVDELQALLMKAAEAHVEGNLPAAISRFEEALEIDESLPEVWVAYAMALVQGGYEKDALDATEKAVSLGESEPQPWYARGHVLRVVGDFAAALPAFEKAVGIAPDLGIAWHELGMVKVETGDLAGAKTAFAKVLELQPDDPAAAEAMAIVQAKMEE